MTQQELEALLAQMGQLGPGDFREETKQEDIPNPASTANGGLDPNAALTIKGPVVYRTWVKPGTNQRLTVKVGPDGTYTKTFHGSDPEIKLADATTGTQRQEWRTEGTPDGQGGYDNSRPMMAEYINGKRTGVTRAPSAKELEDWNLAGQMTRNPGGKTDADIKAEQDKAEAKARQDKLDADAAAARNAPKPVSTNTTDAYIVQTGPDGTLITSPNPNYVGPKPEHSKVKGADGKTYVVSVGPDGKATAAPVQGLPADSGGFAPEPSGAPALDTTYGAVTASLARYRDFLNEQVNLYTKSNGTQGIPAAQADKLMASRLAQAEASIKETQGVVDTQRGIQNTGVTQRGQTLTDTQGRRSAAESTFSTVMGQFMPLLKYLPPGSGETFMKGMQEMLGLGLHNAEVWGGQRESPEVPLGPMAAAANRAGPQGSFLAPYQPSGPPPPPSGATPPIGPPIGPISDPRDAGGVPPSVNAGQSTVAPLLPPPPPVAGGPTFVNPTTGGFGIPDGIGLNSQPSPPPSVPQPSADPNAPQGMTQPQQGTFLDAYGRPQPHPDSELAKLLNDPWFPNHLIGPAYQEVFGQPMPYTVAA